MEIELTEAQIQKAKDSVTYCWHCGSKTKPTLQFDKMRIEEEHGEKVAIIPVWCNDCLKNEGDAEQWDYSITL